MEIKFEPEFSLNLKRDMWFRRKKTYTHTFYLYGLEDFTPYKGWIRCSSFMKDVIDLY